MIVPMEPSKTKTFAMPTTLLGMTMQSPFVVGSGPLGFCGQAMIDAHTHGAGAVVTKTIRDMAAHNPVPHIYGDISAKTMINSELWSDLDPLEWIKNEIPIATAAGVNVIASIGHTESEARRWVPAVDQAGAKAIELVAYDEKAILPMAKVAVSLTDKPVIIKLSPNWDNPLSAVAELIEIGVAGFTAMDSVGPVLRIDIRTRKPVVESEDGRGWLTGAAIKPIVLHYVQKLSEMTSLPIIGLGGVTRAEDVIEFSMAGAHAVGICTALMMRGIKRLGTLISETLHLLDELGYSSLEETRNTLELGQRSKQLQFGFDVKKCTDCGLCRTVCSYTAQFTDKSGLHVDLDRCRYCGLCVSVCPTHALSFLRV